MTMKWLNKDELYTWLPCEAKEAKAYAKRYPEQFIQVPEKLAKRVQAALDGLLEAEKAVADYLKALNI